MSKFPHSQHKPVLVTLGVHIPMMNSIPQSKWNFNKADRTKSQRILDSTVLWIPLIPQNYGRFCSAIISPAKKGFQEDTEKTTFRAGANISTAATQN
ncbi:hypothetical protein JTB14_024998 [Gonioctena quinquepunctata]|nr:hypothetical protein JTB14_024998 [Gonioctena quinquepunctata]